MQLGTYLAAKEELLAQVGEEPESLSFAYRAIKDLSLTDFVLSLSQELAQDDKDLLDELTEKLSQHIPAQYLIGWEEFCGHRFKVDEHVLIPRPETEELVQHILDENEATDLHILDIGTGSGAIAISLAKAHTDWQVTASDISADALSLAQENATRIEANVTFQQSDVLDEIEGRFDIIVSNPPYIAASDKDEVGLNVLHSEPHLALFADEEGLAIYRKIAEQAPQHLIADGKIYLEIGYKQGPAVTELFQAAFPKKRVRLLQDAFGKDRMVVVDNG